MKIYSIAQQEKSLYHDALAFAGISDTSQFPLIQFFRNANNWYRKTNAWIWQATGVWEYDDSNWTTLPTATANLVDEQQDYELPSSAQKIDRVEVKDSEGNYQVLKQIDKSQVKDEAMSEFYETDGMPIYYDIVGRSLMLYPAPSSDDTTLSKGLKVYVSRDISEFSITDTSTEPGFNPSFHRIISLGSAYDYCLSNGITDRQRQIKNEIEQLKVDLQKFYGSRDRDFGTRILPVDTDGI